MNTETFNVPMSTNFLPQNFHVNELVLVAKLALPYISDTDVKNQLVCCLSAFVMFRTPNSLSLIEVMMKAQDAGLTLTDEEALKVLDTAIRDVNENELKNVIEYHVDALIAEKERTNAE